MNVEAKRDDEGPFAIANRSGRRVPDTRFRTYEAAEAYGQKYHTDSHGARFYKIILHPDANRTTDMKMPSIRDLNASNRDHYSKPVTSSPTRDLASYPNMITKDGINQEQKKMAQVWSDKGFFWWEADEWEGTKKRGPFKTNQEAESSAKASGYQVYH